MSSVPGNDEQIDNSLPADEMQSLAINDNNATSPTTTNASKKSPASSSGSPPAAEDPAQSTKIDILLNATGNVPIMKKRKWQVEPEKRISWIISFIHKYLKLDPEDKIFLYVNQTFAPAPDQTVKNLYDCYESNGRLVLYYCKSQAWG